VGSKLSRLKARHSSGYLVPFKLLTFMYRRLQRLGSTPPPPPSSNGSDATTDRTTFHVAFAFDEKWRRDFESLSDAEECAREVSRGGPITWVVERWEWKGSAGCRLRSAFPEELRDEAGELWLRSTAFPPPPRSPAISRPVGSPHSPSRLPRPERRTQGRSGKDILKGGAGKDKQIQ
jgi:hypothetical protein